MERDRNIKNAGSRITCEKQGMYHYLNPMKDFSQDVFGDSWYQSTEEWDRESYIEVNSRWMEAALESIGNLTLGRNSE